VPRPSWSAQPRRSDVWVVAAHALGGHMPCMAGEWGRRLITFVYIYVPRNEESGALQPWVWATRRSRVRVVGCGPAAWIERWQCVQRLRHATRGRRRYPSSSVASKRGKRGKRGKQAAASELLE
jgi:hypothetical protein